MKLTGLVPTRFLFIMMHLIILFTIMQSRVRNVKAGLPLDHSEEEYNNRDTQFLGGLIAGIVLTALELIGFIMGVSMFASVPSLISVLCHSSATISLICMVLDGWNSQCYWLIFGFCSVLPSVIEVGLVISVVILKKSI